MVGPNNRKEQQMLLKLSKVLLMNLTKKEILLELLIQVLQDLCRFYSFL